MLSLSHTSHTIAQLPAVDFIENLTEHKSIKDNSGSDLGIDRVLGNSQEGKEMGPIQGEKESTKLEDSLADNEPPHFGGDESTVATCYREGEKEGGKKGEGKMGRGKQRREWWSDRECIMSCNERTSVVRKGVKIGEATSSSKRRGKGKKQQDKKNFSEQKKQTNRVSLLFHFSLTIWWSLQQLFRGLLCC